MDSRFRGNDKDDMDFPIWFIGGIAGFIMLVSIFPENKKHVYNEEFSVLNRSEMIGFDISLTSNQSLAQNWKVILPDLLNTQDREK